MESYRIVLTSFVPVPFRLTPSSLEPRPRDRSRRDPSPPLLFPAGSPYRPVFGGFALRLGRGLPSRRPTHRRRVSGPLDRSHRRGSVAGCQRAGTRPARPGRSATLLRTRSLPDRTGTCLTSRLGRGLFRSSPSRLLRRSPPHRPLSALRLSGHDQPEPTSTPHPRRSLIEKCVAVRR